MDAFASAVLAHHYPTVPNLGDVRKVNWEQYRGTVDVLVGGPPCQDFSIAGKRAGMDGERGGMSHEFLRILNVVRPKWVVFENVPGLLSSNGGRDFGSFLGRLGQCGYEWAYRVLDAQYFGVPQRRRRVFVVGCFGDANRAAAVLFERACLSGHPTPRRESGSIASALTRNGVGGGGGADDNAGQANHLIAHTLKAEGFDASEEGTGRGVPLVIGFSNTGGDTNLGIDLKNDVMPPVTARNGDPGMIAFDTTQITSRENRCNPQVGDACHPLAAGAHAPAIAFSCKDSGADAGNVAPTLPAMHHDASHANAGGQIAVAFQSSQSGVRASETHATLDANNGSRRHNGVAQGASVRRLTPRECERLMGVPDDYTLVPYRGKPAADGPRYRALGNSMAVPCMRWIGARVQLVDATPYTSCLAARY